MPPRRRPTSRFALLSRAPRSPPDRSPPPARPAPRDHSYAHTRAPSSVKRRPPRRRWVLPVAIRRAPASSSETRATAGAQQLRGLARGHGRHASSLSRGDIRLLRRRAAQFEVQHRRRQRRQRSGEHARQHPHDNADPGPADSAAICRPRHRRRRRCRARGSRRNTCQPLPRQLAAAPQRAQPDGRSSTTTGAATDQR